MTSIPARVERLTTGRRNEPKFTIGDVWQRFLGFQPLIITFTVKIILACSKPISSQCGIYYIHLISLGLA
jgi:hypothetical protein